jgi:uncharacterized membrane protein
MMDTMAPALRRNAGTSFALWVLIGVYAVARVLQIVPGKVPMLTVVALHVFPPVIFALIHGAILYRPRGVAIFVALCLVIGNLFENIGIRTGFPFGSYYFTDVMGPRLFGVPVLLGVAYVGMGYLAWTLGCIILGETHDSLASPGLFTVPVFAAFIMVAWDLSMDAVWSTLVRAWIWRAPGRYFGVPATNFLGWFLTLYIIYQSFAWYLRSQPKTDIRLGHDYWHLAIAFYGISAAGNLLLALPRATRFSGSRRFRCAVEREGYHRVVCAHLHFHDGLVHATRLDAAGVPRATKMRWTPAAAYGCV